MNRKTIFIILLVGMFLLSFLGTLEKEGVTGRRGPRGFRGRPGRRGREGSSGGNKKIDANVNFTFKLDGMPVGAMGGDRPEGRGGQHSRGGRRGSDPRRRGAGRRDRATGGRGQGRELDQKKYGGKGGGRDSTKDGAAVSVDKSTKPSSTSELRADDGPVRINIFVEDEGVKLGGTGKGNKQLYNYSSYPQGGLTPPQPQQKRKNEAPQQHKSQYGVDLRQEQGKWGPPRFQTYGTPAHKHE